ncbi:MmgE/PrpD family protein, partial [candidate division KSB1 bacterium]|nr:MmgE/PrpD family protein [candidate division KSB1 bacterium]
MESYLEKLSAFYSNLKIDGIPETVMDKAKLSLLDYLFVYVVGFHKGTLTQAILDYIKHKRKNFESSIMLTGMKADTELAAFASGLIAHSVELDDGHRFGTAHPAAVVIPAALAEVEKQNATLGKLLKAIVIGYDVMLRLSK